MLPGLIRRPLYVIPPRECPACTMAAGPLHRAVPGGIAICSGCAAALLVGPDLWPRRPSAGEVFGLVLDDTWDDVEMVQRVFLRRIEQEPRRERLA